MGARISKKTYIIIAALGLIGIIAEVFILSRMNIIGITTAQYDDAVLWGSFFYILLVVPNLMGADSKYCRWITKNEISYIILSTIGIIVATFFILFAQYT